MTTTLPSKFINLKDIICHPLFTSWCYGKDFNTIYVSYSNETNIKYKYINGIWVHQV